MVPAMNIVVVVFVFVADSPCRCRCHCHPLVVAVVTDVRISVHPDSVCVGASLGDAVAIAVVVAIVVVRPLWTNPHHATSESGTRARFASHTTPGGCTK